MKEIKKANELSKKKFKEAPYKDRIIFLPQCLRNPDCKAKTTEEGIICLGCGRCNIAGFKKEAEKLGYKLFIVPGSSIVKTLIKKYKPKAVVGVACLPELKEAIIMVKKYSIAAQGVLLSKDGCVNTEVDWKKLRDIIY